VTDEDKAGILFGSEPTAADILASLPWWLKDAPKPRKKSWFMGAISPSKMRLAQECQQKWSWRYTHRRREASGPAATVGKLVHGAYEDAGERRVHTPQGKERPPRVASVEELLFLLEHQEAQLLRENDLDCQVTGEMYEDAREIVALSGPKDFSHAVGNEQHVKVFLPGHGYRIGGKVDRLDLIGGASIHDPTKVVVVDYKTDRSEWTREKLDTDPQPGVYLIWARRQYPNAKEYWFCLDLVRLGKQQWVRWTQAYQDAIVSRIASTVNTFQSGSEKARVGDHCKWCSYREGDEKWPACKAYTDFMKATTQPDFVEGGFDATPLPGLLRLYRESTVAFKLHEARKAIVKELIIDRMGRKSKYAAGCYTATVSYDRRTSYPTPWGLVNELAASLGLPVEALVDDLLNVKGGLLKKLVKGLKDPEKKSSAERILACRESVSTSDAKLTVRVKKAPW
jgi:hypothetical protein